MAVSDMPRVISAGQVPDAATEHRQALVRTSVWHLTGTANIAVSGNDTAARNAYVRRFRRARSSPSRAASAAPTATATTATGRSACSWWARWTARTSASTRTRTRSGSSTPAAARSAVRSALRRRGRSRRLRWRGEARPAGPGPAPRAPV